MKKIIFFSIIIIVALFTITGCSSNSTKQASKTSFNTFKIKDVTFTFDQDTKFHNFKFKNSKELTKDESKYSLHLEYANNNIYDGRFVYRISLAYNDETNLEKFLDGYESKVVKSNGITWHKVIIKGTTDNKETKAVVYATEKNSTVYAVTAVEFTEANVDIDKLAEVFVNGVQLK